VTVWSVVMVTLSMATVAVTTDNSAQTNVTRPSLPLSRAAVSLPYVLRLSAFNIKTFGRSKMSDPFVAGIIRDIVLRYDLILIQEIRDISGEALQELHDMVGRSTFGLTVSARLGRTSYKEEYAYFYRYERLTLLDTHQYADSQDVFEREPYCARFEPVGGAGWQFSVIGLHAKPSDAVAEIDALLDVYDDVRRVWPSAEDVIIMGDLNAACSYASEKDLLPLPIYNEDLFYWPLGFDADTTTSSTVCAYDRFIVAGPNVRTAFIPGSEDIYQYELTHGLSYEQMMDVSDHYPIEIEIY